MHKPSMDPKQTNRSLFIKLSNRGPPGSCELPVTSERTIGKIFVSGETWHKTKELACRAEEPRKNKVRRGLW